MDPTLPLDQRAQQQQHSGSRVRHPHQNSGGEGRRNEGKASMGARYGESFVLYGTQDAADGILAA